MILQLRATPEEVMRAVEAVQAWGQQERLQEREVFGLALALEECSSNIVDHAYRRDPSRKFQVVVNHAASTVTIELRDRGPAFDPTQAQVTKPQSDEDERPPGGWGIPLVRHYMDEIRYRREGGENVLLLTKILAREVTQDPETKTKHQ